MFCNPNKQNKGTATRSSKRGGCFVFTPFVHPSPKTVFLLGAEEDEDGQLLYGGTTLAKALVFDPHIDGEQILSNSATLAPPLMTPSTPVSVATSHGDGGARMEGILYKRRDFYTRQWRPRWFVLTEQDHMLTYYLLRRGTGAPNSLPLPSTISTPIRRPSQAQQQEREEQQEPLLNVIDHEGTPRGHIYLPVGSSVQAEVGMSEEGLLVFSIMAPQQQGGAVPEGNNNQKHNVCYLASTTPHDRDRWMDAIKRIVSHPGEVLLQRPPERIPATASTHDEQPQELGTTRPADQGARTASSWDDVDPDEASLSGLPEAMKERIRSVFQEHFPLLTKKYDQNHQNDDDWSKMFENRDGVTAYERNYGDTGDNIMIKSEAILKHHPPKQLANLFLDLTRRNQYETNVRYDERLRVYNAHTFCDYYAYNPIWPASARDFLVLVHWKIIRLRKQKRGNHNGIEDDDDDDVNSLVIFAFSYPEENDLKPPPADHVRGHLAITMTLLTPVVVEGGAKIGTRMTRILSYDLQGNLPASITRAIIQQQATMPHVVESFLTRTEPNPPERLTSSTTALTTEAVIKDIVERLPEDEENSGVDSIRRRLRFAPLNGGGGRSVSTRTHHQKLATSSTNPTATSALSTQHDEAANLTIPKMSVILTSPMLLWNVMANSPLKEVVFCLSAIMAIRVVAMSQMNGSGGRLHLSRRQETTGVITYSSQVDLKGVLQLLAKRREDESTHHVVSIVHVATRAILQALYEMNGLNFHHASVPFFGLEGWTRPATLRLNQADVGLAEGASRKTLVLPLSTIPSLDDLASEFEENDSDTEGSRQMIFERLGLTTSQEIPDCQFFTCSERGSDRLDMTVSPANATAVVVCMGGVRLVRDAGDMNSVDDGASEQNGYPSMMNTKPVVQLSVTANSSVWSVSEARRFAARLQQLMESPAADTDIDKGAA